MKNELYKADFDKLPPDEREAWKFDHYRKTRLAIDKYFTSYGLDVAMIIGMMDRAKENDIRYATMIQLIEDKALPSYSMELDGLESMLASLFNELLRPFPDEQPSVS